MDLKRLKKEYKRYEPYLEIDGECVTDCYQRSFKDKDGKRKYFLTWKKYDFSRYISTPDFEEPRYEGETQLTYKKNGQVIDLKFLNGWEVNDAEDFLRQLFNTGWFARYDNIY